MKKLFDPFHCKSYTIVTGNDKQSVSYLILDTPFVYHFVEVTVNVSANPNVLGIRK